MSVLVLGHSSLGSLIKGHSTPLSFLKTVYLSSSGPKPKGGETQVFKPYWGGH